MEMSLTSGVSESSQLHHKVLDSYLRILESVMNETLGKVAAEEFGNCLFINKDGNKFFDHKHEETVSIRDFEGQISIKAFVELLSDVGSFGNLSLDNLNREYSELVDYFQDELVPFIEKEEIIGLRAAFRAGQNVQVSRERVFSLRNQILGVGCVGVINNLFERVYDSKREHYLKHVG